MLKSFRALLLAALFMPSTLLAQTSTLAATPPMGWNSWNLFAGRVTDKDVRAAADAMVSSGMKDAGYIYVNIDDTWQGERDAQGNIQANSKFPDMKALADYVHSKGLKIGIYSGPGAQTCAKYEGSLGHEAQDAKTYADWGIRLSQVRPLQLSQEHDGAGSERSGKSHPDDEGCLREDAQGAAGNRTPHRLQLLPVRLGRSMGVGTFARSQPMADHRGHQSHLGSHDVDRLFSGRPV